MPLVFVVRCQKSVQLGTMDDKPTPVDNNPPLISSSSAEILVSGAAVLETAPDAKQHEQQLPSPVLGDKATTNGVGVKVDPSAWPIVHGSRASADHTPLRQPHGDPQERFYLFNSQRVQENQQANGLYMGQLLMQNVNGGAGGSSQVAGQAAPGVFDEAGAMIDFDMDDANAVSVITEQVSDQETRLWTSTIGNVVVFRQVVGASGLERLATLNHGRNHRFHGSYAFVASNGTENGFFTTMEDRVVRFVLRGNDKEGWRILQTGEEGLRTPATVSNPSQASSGSSTSSGGASGNDHLVGLTLLDDGTIITCSKKGVVMAVRLDKDGDVVFYDSLALNAYAKGGPAYISNSISSSGQGIFVVTHRELLRVDFEPQMQKLVFKWTSLYHPDSQTPPPWYVGRLGPGSGSTPTVTECQGRELVVITDGALPMNLLWYDTTTGELAARRTVQFSPDREDGNFPTTSEQSVAVDGCKAFVVQNYMGTERLDDSIVCASAPRSGSGLRKRLGDYCLSRKDPANPSDLFPVRACPIIFGCSAYGAALYEITGPGQEDVIRVWTRDDVSCGTSIPLISTNPESRVVYCVGLTKGSNQWALLGMDLDTGANRANLQFYERNLALNALANPFYAGVEATGDNMVTIGAIGGVLHLSPECPHRIGGGDGGTMSFLGVEEGGQDLRLIVDRSSKASLGNKLKGAFQSTSTETTVIAALVSLVVLLAVLFRFRRTSSSPRMPR